MSEEIGLAIVFMILSASIGAAISVFVVPIIWDFIEHIPERRRERINRKIWAKAIDGAE